MSAQNSYRLDSSYKRPTGWSGWVGGSGLWPGVTWRDAIQKWLDECWIEGSYKVVSETPSEDHRSGIIEIQVDSEPDFWVGVKIKSTLLEEV